MSNETQAIELRTDRAAFEPSNVEQALVLATKMSASGLMPRSFQKPEAILTAIVMGRELGLTAMQSVRSIHVIEGKPSMSADLIVGLVKRSADCLYFQLVESTNIVARYETHRKGDPKPTAMAFSFEDAKLAQVTGKDNWKKYPAAMLRARCGTALARAVYPDIAMGLYDPDELEPARERDVTPAPAPTTRKPREKAAPVEQPPTIDSMATVIVDAEPPPPTDADRPDADTVRTDANGVVVGDAGEVDEVAMLINHMQDAETLADLKHAGEMVKVASRRSVNPLVQTTAIRDAILAVYNERWRALNVMEVK